MAACSHSSSKDAFDHKAVCGLALIGEHWGRPAVAYDCKGAIPSWSFRWRSYLS